MRALNFLFLIAFGVVMIYATFGLPNRGDANAVVNQEISPAGTPEAAAFYIKNAYKDMHTPNIVTAILADYRGYDTLGEETVIFTAGIICLLLLRRNRRRV